MCGQEDNATKEAWKGRGPAEHNCDLAQAPQVLEVAKMGDAMQKLEMVIQPWMTYWLTLKVTFTCSVGDNTRAIYN
jgi:hypothetical protein